MLYRSVEQLAAILGYQDVAFISQDDKSRVPLGITATHKQAPILMHLEYKVSLPDHDWVVAAGHKLIPSVYAGIRIDDDNFGDPRGVSYSGPTYIAIRSAANCSSTAATHAFDFETLTNLTSFEEILYSEYIKFVQFQ